MISVLTYILKWALSLALLYLPFALLLRKETFATLNRRLLLCTIIASALLPSIIVRYPVEIELPAETTTTIFAGTHTTPPAVTATGIKEILAPRNIFIIYSVGVIANTLFLTISLIKANRSIKRGTIWIDRQKRMTIYCHADNTAPFSLFRNVVISQSDYDEYSKEILLHEEGHIRHGHSYDMLLICIVKALQWFNPFIYLLANDIKEIHEYEADRYVLQHNGNTQAYQMLILKKAVGNSLIPFANSFSQSHVRKRIKMMVRNESSSIQRLKWLYMPFVSTLCIGAFAQPEYIYIRKSDETLEETTLTQQETNKEYNLIPTIICRPAVGKATIAHNKTSAKQLPKEISMIEPPVIEEEQLFTDNYCEYIDLENSTVAGTLKAKGIRKCDIKVRFTTRWDGTTNDVSITSCNISTPGNATPDEIEQIKETAATATIEYIANKQWHKERKTRYNARIIYHYGPSMEIASNNTRHPLMAGTTAIR